MPEATHRSIDFTLRTLFDIQTDEYFCICFHSFSYSRTIEGINKFICSVENVNELMLKRTKAKYKVRICFFSVVFCEVIIAFRVQRIDVFFSLKSRSRHHRLNRLLHVFDQT